MLRNM